MAADAAIFIVSGVKSFSFAPALAFPYFSKKTSHK
jgi:hypothetical protein